MRHIVVLDSARKWGGGTSSLLALLKGLQGGRYSFRAVFYDNFSFGTQSDIQTELQKIQVESVALGRFRPSLGIKLLKETIRVGLCFSRPWRARAIFSLDYQTRILPDAARLADVLRREHADLVYLNNQPSENLDGILAARAAGIPVVQHARSSVRIRPLEASLTNSHVHRVVCEIGRAHV